MVDNRGASFDEKARQLEKELAEKPLRSDQRALMLLALETGYAAGACIKIYEREKMDHAISPAQEKYDTLRERLSS